jgi:5-methylcytosine-specific restriction endonuclease McrA
MIIISCKEAKQQGLTQYFTGKPCIRGHIAHRLVSNGTCMECSRLLLKNYREINKEKLREKARENARLNRQKNGIKLKIYRHQWYLKNREAILARVKQNNMDRPEIRRLWRERHKEDIQIYTRNQHKLTRARRTALQGKRRASQQNATPSWLTVEDFEEMVALYEKAKELTKITGIKHHVDHIIPLMNKNVCGLHVQWNLQILTESENISKGNRLDFLDETS